MKITGLLLLALMFSISIFGQKDTTKIKLGNKKIIIIDDDIIAIEGIEKLQNGILQFEEGIEDPTIVRFEKIDGTP